MFAHIYLNEFDRYVRHQLKPQAYVRYGDDFLLFFLTRRGARLARRHAGNYLHSELRLTINPKNDVVASAASGLKFLGHAVTKTFAVTDRHTTQAVLGKVSWQNISSYRALPLVPAAKNRLDWILLEKYVDI